MKCIHRFSILTSMALVAAFMPKLAAGATCGEPSISDCHNPDYLKSECGLQNNASATSACPTKLAPIYKYETEHAPDVTQKVVMAPDQPDAPVWAASKGYQFPNHRVDGSDGSFHGFRQKSKLAAVYTTGSRA